MASPLPAGSVRALLETDLVTPPTRAALLERLQTPPAEAPRFFTSTEFAALRAVCDRLLAREEPLPVDIAGPIDARLAGGEGDGWRYDALPPDGDALRQLLRAVDEAAQTAHGAPFAQLAALRKDALLHTLQADAATKRAWEKLRTECAEIFYSHPLAQQEIGYTGFAGAQGWGRVGLDEPEEVETRRQGDKVTR